MAALRRTQTEEAWCSEVQWALSYGKFHCALLPLHAVCSLHLAHAYACNSHTCKLLHSDRLEAMYATMGYIVPEYYKFPGFLSPSLGLKFSDVPNGLAALSKSLPQLL